VVEVGPGMGMISRQILETGAHLTAIEKDDRLLAFLQTSLQPDYTDTFSALLGDAVEFPLAGVADVESLTVIANPPFAITGPWIAAVLDLGFPKIIALILQKEAVERITAKAGSKSFGVLAIRLSAAYEVSDIHPVPPQSFYPPPNIDSQIVVFSRKAHPHALAPEFILLVQQLFIQRRKQIGGRLKSILSPSQFHEWEALLSQRGFSLQVRPEQIPWDVWIALNQISSV